jgi:PEGA domain-containing protein
MIGFIALLPLVASAVSEPIVLSEGRKPLAFILSTPSGAAGTTSSSDIIRIVTDLLAKHTSLKMNEIDAAQVADCKGRIGCFVTKIGASSGRKDAPELLLVISKLTQAGAPDRISATLVDATRALEVVQEVSRRDEDWETELEARIFESAVLVRPRFATLKDRAETEKYLEDLFTRELRGPFESRSAWEPYGSIQIDGVEPGIAIALDGTTVGETRPGSTHIVSVLGGPRKIELTSPKFQPFATEVVVERGRTAEVKAHLETTSASSYSGLRTALFWTGTGVAIAGAAITAVAIARQNGDVSTFCVSRSDSSCKESKAFATVGYNPSAAPSFENKVNPPGILLAPLGYSLLGAGATWALTTLLLDRPDEPPWLELGIGFAVGAAAYGMSAILNGKSAFPN